MVSVATAEPAEVRRLLEHLLLVNRTKKVVVVADDVDPPTLPPSSGRSSLAVSPTATPSCAAGCPATIDPTCLPDEVTSRLGIDATGFDHCRCKDESPSRPRPRPGRSGPRRRGHGHPDDPAHRRDLRASGAVYGVRLLEVLKDSPIETNLVITGNTQRVIELETGSPSRAIEALADEVHDDKDVEAAIASGSFKTNGSSFAVLDQEPVGDRAHYNDTLIIRATNVVLKNGACSCFRAEPPCTWDTCA